MTKFFSAVVLVPLALFAGGIQKLLGRRDRDRCVGAEVPDETLIRITPSKVRILQQPPR